MKHTEGKWIVVTSGAEHRIILDSEPFSMTIARCRCGTTDEANAHRIVQAVNLLNSGTFDKMVEALEASNDYIREILLSEKKNYGSNCEADIELQKTLEQALAAAKGAE